MLVVRGKVSPKRICDKCGAYRPANTLRKVSGRMICSWHDYYVAPEVLDRQPLKTFKIKPYKDAKPLDARDTYERAEWELLQFLERSYNLNQYNIPDYAAPIPLASLTQTSYGVDTAAWTAIYCYELITEDRRPRRMVQVARNLLRTCAEMLVSRQYASPNTTPSVSDQIPSWGAWSNANLAYPNETSFTIRHCAAAGLALLRAYQVFGDSRYLSASRAAIWFCRTAQCTGKLAVTFTSSDAIGNTPLHLGTWTQNIHLSGGNTFPDNKFSPGEMIALEFYVAFRSVIGDETIGSSGLSGGTFSSSRESTITNAIAEAVAFWTGAGTYDVTRGSITNGFTTTTPFEHFAAYPDWDGSWRYVDGTQSTGTYAYSENWAHGLRGLRAAVGDTALVTGIFDWLMSFTSNPAHALPESYSDRTLYGDRYTNGEYDPTFCLADELLLRSNGSDVRMSGTAARQGYSLATAGLLAPLFSSRQQVSFKNLKDNLNTPRHHSIGRGEDGRYHSLLKAGRCGFSLQPTQKNGRFYVPVNSARLGLVYRHAPQSFSERGRQ